MILPHLGPGLGFISGLRGSALAFWLAQQSGRWVVVLDRGSRMEPLAGELATYAPGKAVLKLPSRSGSPFLPTQQHQRLRLSRLQTFFALQQDHWDILLTSVETLLERLPPKDCLAQPRLHLETGMNFDPDQAVLLLSRMGYRHQDLVNEPGDFARRGGILDLFPMDSTHPLRIETHFDSIEEIRRFDPHSQRSVSPCDDVDVLPADEWVVGPEQLAHFAREGGRRFNRTQARRHFLDLYARLESSGSFPGMEHWVPLFFEHSCKLWEYTGEATFLFEEALACEEALAQHIQQWSFQAEEAEHGHAIHMDLASLCALDASHALDMPNALPRLGHLALAGSSATRTFLTRSAPKYEDDFARFLRDWETAAEHARIVLVAETRAGMQAIEHMAEARGLSLQETHFPLGDLRPGWYIAQGLLNSGFEWPERELLVVAESEIWARKGRGSRRVQGKRAFFSDLADLKPGDFVVHREQGVGRFQGLVDVRVGEGIFEMMAIEYHGHDKLYLSLSQLDLVQRLGPKESHVALDRLGGLTWSRTLARVRHKVRELAIDLLQLYAQRELVQGLACGPDNDLFWEFEQDFPYQATPDQLRASEEIKEELRRGSPPMDRILVGDVGFGKTEVAMRFAYKLVLEGAQVAILCPTTVLAFQHFHSFRRRFAKTPTRIAWVSRFSSSADLKTFKQQLVQGQIDIAIGTHRLLSPDIQFRQLGGLVIDEEQRFGVGHKEKLKETRKQVHVLSMSATPIPRSLNMAFSGIRSLSVMESPPSNRMAISTNIIEFHPAIIRNAIQFEIDRGGQVFFVHNRVESMPEMLHKLRGMLPHVSMEAAHGQMESKALEDVMMRFIEGGFQLLLTTTIIENGVDIPNVNTMIVHQAHQFGLSQLYQLRGRIGRSDRPAYAYLVVPTRGRMSDEARSRIAALEEFTELGAGFRIASRDMEVRGVGDLLGARQSGFIEAVGYQTYARMLEETIAELRGRPIEDRVHCVLTLRMGASIPRHYMESTPQRLNYYQRLARAESLQEVEDLRDEAIDCFGPAPGEFLRLTREMRLKVLAQQAGVCAVEREGQGVRLRFQLGEARSAERIAALAGRLPQSSLEGEGSLRLNSLPFQDPDQLYANLEHSLHLLKPPAGQTGP